MAGFFRRSIARALTLRLVTASALVCVLVFSLVYAGLRQQGISALQQTIDTDIAGLVDIYATQKAEGLTKTIEARLDLAPMEAEQSLYLLRDAEGQILVGNVAVWPALDAAKSEAGRVTLSGESALARTTQLRDGYQVLVGRQDARLNAMLMQVGLLFLGALALLIAASVWIGHMASVRLRQRVEGLNSVFDALEQGHMDVRAEAANRGEAGDELDALGRHVNAAVARMGRLLAAQRDVSDHTAHETRTPLMSLERDIALAQAATTDPSVLQPLEAAQTRIRDLLRLLDALLDIASAEAQRGDQRALEEINISEVARLISELYEYSAEEAGLKLVCDIDEAVFMRADAMQMSRLLVNLLDNALKYGRSETGSGEIRLSVKPGPVIVVEDDGSGVEEAEKTHIFDRYRRSQAPIKGARGHGLGLALVKAIAARHDLGVRVEDVHPKATHKGARFVLSAEEAA